MSKIIEEKVVSSPPARPPISWGAIFAGVVFVLAISWLLYLLGVALGLTVVGPAEVPEAGEELGWSAAIWMLVTSLIAFFLGGLFAARIAGIIDKTEGMLHGLAVWGLSTLLALLLGTAGVSTLLQTGQSLVKGGAALGTMAAGAIGAAEVDVNIPSSVIAGLQARLKVEVSQALARAAQDEGGKLSEERARRALDQLDRETTTGIVVQLVRGNPESAKTILAANTTLNQAEIEQLIKGLSQEVSSYMQTLQVQAKKTADYSAAVLWTVFISSSVGLIMAIIGGRLGAQAGIRIYRRRVV
jgi:MFS family permease